MTVQWRGPYNPWSGAPLTNVGVNELASDGAGIILAIDESTEQISKSTDAGLTWAYQTELSTEFNGGPITDVAFGSNGAGGRRWAIVGLYGGAGGNGLIYTSDNDGSTWTQRAAALFGTSKIERVHYANSIWVCAGSGGKLATSTDGATWTLRTTGLTGSIQILGWDGTQWFIFDVTNHTGKYAADPTGSWTTRSGSIPTWVKKDGYYGNGKWVLVGHVSGTPKTGKVATASSIGGAFSDQTITWYDSGSTASIITGAYNGSKHVVVGGFGQYADSTDAATWTVYRNQSPIQTDQSLLTIAVDTGSFLIGDDFAGAYAEGSYALQVRSEVDGTLLYSTALSQQAWSMRRAPNGQMVYVLQGSNTLLRFDRTATQQASVTITGFWADVNDWNVDDAYAIYRLGSNSVYKWNSAGTLQWTTDLFTDWGFRAPTRQIAAGNGQQVYTGRSSGDGAASDAYLRVVGYIGGADWLTGVSEAALVTMRRSDGVVESVRRFGGDADDHAQAIGVIRYASCLFLCGAANGTEFEGTALSGTQGWLLRIPTGLL